MKRFFNKRIMIISTAAILLTAFFCTYAYYRVFREEVVENLKVYCRLLSESAVLEDDNALNRYADELYEDNIRLTLVGKDGEVIFDNMAKVEDLNNHKNRAEIEEAMEYGEGSSVRRSETINRTNYYYAIRLENGSILRAARESRSIFDLFLNALPVIFLATLLILFVCFVTVNLSARRFLAPIEALASNMDTPENIEIYDSVDQMAVLSIADAFITHCGMNSASEGLYFQVPLVLFPQTPEQGAVARRTEELGAGVRLKSIAEDDILQAVKQVMFDPAYKNNAARTPKDYQ